MDFSAKCTKTIHILFVLLFALVPLLVTPWNYELFEYNKMMAVYAFAVLIATTWGIKAIHEKKIVIPKTPLDIPIFLFVLSQTVSTLFSIDPHVSWFGYYSRFNGGLLSTLAYVALYYIFISSYSRSNLEAYTSNVSEKFSPPVGGSNNKKFRNFELVTPQSSLHTSVFNLLYASLISAFFVSIYAVLERLGIDSHLWVQDVQSRVFSTLGQPNWLAAYIVALIPTTWAFAILSLRDPARWRGEAISQSKGKSTNKIATLSAGWRIARNDIASLAIWTTLSSLFFFVLLSTRSKSGLGAFVIADILFWGLLFWSSQQARKIQGPPAGEAGLALKHMRIPFFFLHGAFLLIVFFNGIYIESFDKYFTFTALKNRFTHSSEKSAQQLNNPIIQQSSKPSAPLLETGGTDSGVIRKYVWTGAITAWKSSIKTFFIGTGTESFAFAFFQFRPKEHNLTSEWDFLYNKAHNEYVNFLTTTGIFGLLSYLFFIGNFCWWYFKSTISNFQYSLKSSKFKFQIALFAGWISILITNFFGFAVVITQVYLFLFPTIVFVIHELTYSNEDTRMKKLESRVFSIHLHDPFHKASMWIIALSGVSLVVLLGIYWDADRLFAHGYRLSRVGSNEQAVSSTEQAILRNPGEPVYHDELSTELAGVAVAAMEANEATRASAVAQRAINENNIALGTSPKNVNFWKSRVKILYAFSSFDPSLFKLSLETLRQAQELSPNDPKIAYNIAVIAGKQGDTATAIDALKKAIVVKPNYRDAYYALYIFYTELKQTDNARDTIRDYLATVDPEDKEFKALVQ